jgi:hypothetical protein
MNDKQVDDVIADSKIPPIEDLEFAIKGLEIARLTFSQLGSKRRQAEGCKRVIDFLRDVVKQLREHEYGKEKL